MEQPGSHYAVLLHDAQLRNGLITEAERSRTARHGSSSRLRLRVWFAHAMRGLAARVEPAEPALSVASQRQAAAVQS